MSGKNFIVYEYDKLVSDANKIRKEGDKEIDSDSFESLIKFENRQLENQERVLTHYKSGKREYISVGKYVGTIQTDDGTVIEILPKIYRENNTLSGEKEAKEIFLNMLKYFLTSECKSFNNVNLETKANFPLFEIYVSGYISEVDYVLSHGLKKNYRRIEENHKYLKGKLILKEQLRKNITDRTKFCVSYINYIENIPQNRIIVSTLKQLLYITKISSNKTGLYRLLNVFADIPKSDNILKDMRQCLNADRTFDMYKTLMLWSEQFLLGKGFTTFWGNTDNTALLFPAERLFESFVAHLFKRYAPEYGYDVKIQNTEFNLVDTRLTDNSGMFRMRPDIVLEKSGDPFECVIIDTKWKVLDENKIDNNYLMAISDMYQLYAYGRKYKKNLKYDNKNKIDTIPRLILVYPYSQTFKKELDSFIYEEIKEKYGLMLTVVPFNLAEKDSYKEQIENIIYPDYKPDTDRTDSYKVAVSGKYIDSVDGLELSESDRQYILVGCYRNKDHLKWIQNQKKYNVRLGNVRGALGRDQLEIHPYKLFLYDVNNPKYYMIYSLNTGKSYTVTRDTMENKLGYKPSDGSDSKEYYIYVLDRKLIKGEKIQIDELIKKYKEQCKAYGIKEISEGAPFFVYKTEDL